MTHQLKLKTMMMKMFSLLLLLASVAVISINAEICDIPELDISLMEKFCGSCGEKHFDMMECGKHSSRICSAGGVDGTPLPSYCSTCENAQVTDWEDMSACRTALHEHVRSLPGCDEMNTFCSSCWGGTTVCNSDDDIDEFCENPINGVDAPAFCQDSSCKHGDHSEGCRLSASRYYDAPRICDRPDLDGVYTTSKGGSMFGGVPSSVVSSTGTTFKMPTADLTVELWVMPDTIGDDDQTLFSYATLEPGDNTLKWCVDAYGDLRIHTKNSDWHTGVHLLAYGAWRHLAFTYDAPSGERKVYLDGFQASTSTSVADGLPSLGSLYLGQAHTKPGEELSVKAGQSFGGCLGEFRVWDVVRTADEVKASMNLNVVPHDNLMHRYSFGPHKGEVLLDLGRESQDLTARGLERCVKLPGPPASRFQGNSESWLSSGGARGSYSMPNAALTVEMWIKAEPHSSIGTAIFSYATQYQGDNTFLLFINEIGNLQVYIKAQHWNTGNYVTNEEWQHLAVTYDASGKAEVYQNGYSDQLIGFSGGGLYSLGYLYVGQDQDKVGGLLDETQAFRGCLRGELRVWDVVRTAEEIKASMNLNVAPHANLMHLYRLDGTILQGSVEDFGTAGQALTAQSLALCVKLPPAGSASRFQGNSESWLFSGDDMTDATAGDTAYIMPSKTLTVEMWMKAGSDSKGTALLSYATEEQGANTFLIFIDGDGKLDVYIKDQSWSPTNQVVTNGLWQHLAVTYDASSRKGQVFRDGYSHLRVTGLMVGELSPLGVLYVGQEQDSVGGHLADNQAFRGCLRGELRVWDVVRTAEEIKASMNLNVPPHANLMHLYRLDGTILQGSVEDFGTAGQALTAQSLVPCVDPPRTGSRFQGNSASRLSSATGYSMPTTALTVEMWIKAGVDSKRTALFSYATEAQGPDTVLLMINGFGKLQVEIKDQPWGTPTGYLMDDKWHHLSLTYDGSTGVAEHYLDGYHKTTIRSFTVGELSPVGVLYVGQEQDSFGGHLADNQAFRGCLRGELRVWDVVRTGEEILASMNINVVVPHDNLMHLYKFEGPFLQGSVEDFGTAGQALTAQSLALCAPKDRGYPYFNDAPGKCSDVVEPDTAETTFCESCVRTEQYPNYYSLTPECYLDSYLLCLNRVDSSSNRPSWCEDGYTSPFDKSREVLSTWSDKIKDIYSDICPEEGETSFLSVGDGGGGNDDKEEGGGGGAHAAERWHCCGWGCVYCGFFHGSNDEI